jgi:transposase InsO family protein
LKLDAISLVLGQGYSKAAAKLDARLIIHSNQGSQHASKAAASQQSHKGDCWDNAIAERFLQT